MTSDTADLIRRQAANGGRMLLLAALAAVVAVAILVGALLYDATLAPAGDPTPPVPTGTTVDATSTT